MYMQAFFDFLSLKQVFRFVFFSFRCEFFIFFYFKVCFQFIGIDYAVCICTTETCMFFCICKKVAFIDFCLKKKERGRYAFDFSLIQMVSGNLRFKGFVVVKKKYKGCFPTIVFYLKQPHEENYSFGQFMSNYQYCSTLIPNYSCR